MKPTISYYIPLLLALFSCMCTLAQYPNEKSLNGKWLMGIDRNYIKAVDVPGITADPNIAAKGETWFKKEVSLPQGEWQFATLELKGARFLPRVYVDGKLVSEKKGGMAPTYHLLMHKDVSPGNTIAIEIALSSLADVPADDASCIPPADRWRTDNSSGIWDDVVLHFHGDQFIKRMTPYYNLAKKTVTIHFDVGSVTNESTISGKYKAEIFSEDGKLLLSDIGKYVTQSNQCTFNYGTILKEWTPDTPNLYQCRLILTKDNRIEDCDEQSIGIKDFTIHNKQFYLNNKPCKLLGGTVVWHRWVRSEEGRELGYDTAWFANNIIKRLKDHGANYLRFHLGLPPERLLDLCDKYGLLVQFEWSFFHGMPAKEESLLTQLPAWLDVAMKHPCAALFHPYNETQGDQLKTMWSALDELLISYPKILLEDRDVTHIHKYWWSLFENLGLYYDNANQFDKAIMVDEFGGNYLDSLGNLGGYKALKESNLRLLGRNNTAEERLEMQCLSNGKVAEYWRRIGAAGVAPFCILSSWEDGNNWFMGNLKDGKPKPVWNALTVAFSSQAVSMEIWDHNFVPHQKVDVPLYFFNDTGSPKNLIAEVSIEDSTGQVLFKQDLTKLVGDYSKAKENMPVTLPEKTGSYKLKTTLLNPPKHIKYPVVSEWIISVLEARVPANLANVKVTVPDDEKELRSFLQKHAIPIAEPGYKHAQILLTSRKTWSRLVENDLSVRAMIRDAIDHGTSVVMLDVGPRNLGQGYLKGKNKFGSLQGAPRVADPVVSKVELLNGVSVIFTEAAEPESQLHPSVTDQSLWYNLEKRNTYLWNGLRGGLIVPAEYLQVSGLNKAAFIEQWKVRNANEAAIRNGNYFAFELQGFYDFGTNPNDKNVMKRLRSKVQFLVEDAPALAGAINPNSPINVINLSQEYSNAPEQGAAKFKILANAGNNLTRTPVAMIDFGSGKGKLVVSQLLTAGRLNADWRDSVFYAVRYDEAAVQFVLNMMSKSLK